MSKCKFCGKKTKSGRGNGRFCSIDCRFNSKIIKTNFCWNWSGSKISNRYGGIQFGKEYRLAHRVSWELNFGKVPENMCVCHRCDNGLCVNPDHLFLGSHDDNMMDKAIKKRAKRGNPIKIPYSEYEYIKRMLELGIKKYQIAKIYNCTSKNIGKISKIIGLKYDNCYKIKKEDYWKIESLWNEGFKRKEIADIFECSDANIKRILKIIRDQKPEKILPKGH